MKGSLGDFFGRILWRKRESRAKAHLTPAGESLEHNTLVAAGPNLRADGAFRAASVHFAEGGWILRGES